MANQVFNISLGRVVEFYNRVKNNDPGTSRLVIMVLAEIGLESDAILKDKVTFADIVLNSTNEVTNTGYAKKVLLSTDLLAWAPTQPSDVWDLDLPDQTWTGVGTGDNWRRFVVGYDPSSAGVTMTAIIPMTIHDFVVTPDGSDITAQIAAAGFFRAS
jgi:hypothetical protein